jgi:hypothetical protein
LCSRQQGTDCVNGYCFLKSELIYVAFGMTVDDFGQPEIHCGTYDRSTHCFASKGQRLTT